MAVDGSEFKPGDIIVQIGSPITRKFHVKKVQSTTYRVEEIQIRGVYVTSYDRDWVDRDFVKVGRYAPFLGEMPEVDDGGQ